VLSLRYMSTSLKIAPDNAKSFPMNEGPRKILSREERLAAKLRENLRRRKAQARAAVQVAGESDTGNPTETLPNRADES
jgi:hypothetical protein